MKLKCTLSCVLSGLYPTNFEADDVFEAIEIATQKINALIKNLEFHPYTCRIETVAHWKNVLQFGITAEFGGTVNAHRYDYDIKAHLEIVKFT